MSDKTIKSKLINSLLKTAYISNRYIYKFKYFMYIWTILEIILMLSLLSISYKDYTNINIKSDSNIFLYNSYINNLNFNVNVYNKSNIHSNNNTKENLSDNIEVLNKNYKYGYKYYGFDDIMSYIINFFNFMFYFNANTIFLCQASILLFFLIKLYQLVYYFIINNNSTVILPSEKTLIMYYLISSVDLFMLIVGDLFTIILGVIPLSCNNDVNIQLNYICIIYYDSNNFKNTDSLFYKNNYYFPLICMSVIVLTYNLLNFIFNIYLFNCIDLIHKSNYGISNNRSKSIITYASKILLVLCTITNVFGKINEIAKLGLYIGLSMLSLIFTYRNLSKVSNYAQDIIIIKEVFFLLYAIFRLIYIITSIEIELLVYVLMILSCLIISCLIHWLIFWIKFNSLYTKEEDLNKYYNYILILELILSYNINQYYRIVINGFVNNYNIENNSINNDTVKKLHEVINFGRSAFSVYKEMYNIETNLKLNEYCSVSSNYRDFELANINKEYKENNIHNNIDSNFKKRNKQENLTINSKNNDFNVSNNINKRFNIINKAAILNSLSINNMIIYKFNKIHSGKKFLNNYNDKTILTLNNKYTYNVNEINIFENYYDDSIEKYAMENILINFLVYLIEKHILSNQHISQFYFKVLLIQIYIRNLNNYTKAWFLLSVFNETFDKFSINQKFIIFSLFQELKEKLIIIDSNKSVVPQIEVIKLTEYDEVNTKYFKSIETITLIIKDFWLSFIQNKKNKLLDYNSFNDKIYLIDNKVKELSILEYNISTLNKSNTINNIIHNCFLKNLLNEYSLLNKSTISSLKLYNNKLSKKNIHNNEDEESTNDLNSSRINNSNSFDYKSNKNLKKLDNINIFNIYNDEDYLNLDTILESGMIKVSCNALEIGKIKWVNEIFSSLLGFSCIELLKLKINRIIPSSVANNHNEYIKNYVESNKEVLLNKLKTTLLINSENYIMPVIIYTKLLPTILNGIEVCSIVKKIQDNTLLLYKSPEYKIYADKISYNIKDGTIKKNENIYKICLLLINNNGSIEAVDKNSNILIGVPNFIKNGWKINISIDKSKSNIFDITNNLNDSLIKGKIHFNFNLNTSIYEDDYYNDENGLFVNLHNKIKAIINTIIKKKLNFIVKPKEKNKNISYYSNVIKEEKIDNLNNKLIIIKSNLISTLDYFKTNSEYYSFSDLEDRNSLEEFNEYEIYNQYKSLMIKVLQKIIIKQIFKDHKLSCEVYSIISNDTSLINYVLKIYYRVEEIDYEEVLDSEYLNELELMINNQNLNKTINEIQNTNEHNQVNSLASKKIINLKPVDENYKNNENTPLISKINRIESNNNCNIFNKTKSNYIKQKIIENKTEVNKSTHGLFRKKHNELNLNIIILDDNIIDTDIAVNIYKKNLLLENDAKLSSKKIYIKSIIIIFSILVITSILFSCFYETSFTNQILPKIVLLNSLILRRDLCFNTINNIFFHLTYINKIINIDSFDSIFYDEKRLNTLLLKLKNTSIEENLALKEELIKEKILDIIKQDILLLKSVQTNVELMSMYMTKFNSYIHNLEASNNNVLYYNNYNYKIFDNIDKIKYINLQMDVAFNKLITKMDNYVSYLSYNLDNKFIVSDIAMNSMLRQSKKLLDLEQTFISIVFNGLELVLKSYESNVNILFSEIIILVNQYNVILFINIISIAITLIFSTAIFFMFIELFKDQDKLIHAFSNISYNECVKSLVICDKFLRLLILYKSNKTNLENLNDNYKYKYNRKSINGNVYTKKSYDHLILLERDSYDFYDFYNSKHCNINHIIYCIVNKIPVAYNDIKIYGQLSSRTKLNDSVRSYNNQSSNKSLQSLASSATNFNYVNNVIDKKSDYELVNSYRKFLTAVKNTEDNYNKTNNNEFDFNYDDKTNKTNQDELLKSVENNIDIINEYTYLSNTNKKKDDKNSSNSLEIKKNQYINSINMFFSNTFLKLNKNYILNRIYNIPIVENHNRNMISIDSDNKLNNNYDSNEQQIKLVGSNKSIINTSIYLIFLCLILSFFFTLNILMKLKFNNNLNLNLNFYSLNEKRTYYISQSIINYKLLVYNYKTVYYNNYDMYIKKSTINEQYVQQFLMKEKYMYYNDYIFNINNNSTCFYFLENNVTSIVENNYNEFSYVFNNFNDELQYINNEAMTTKKLCYDNQLNFISSKGLNQMILYIINYLKDKYNFLVLSRDYQKWNHTIYNKNTEVEVKTEFIDNVLSKLKLETIEILNSFLLRQSIYFILKLIIKDIINNLDYYKMLWFVLSLLFTSLYVLLIVFTIKFTIKVTNKRKIRNKMLVKIIPNEHIKYNIIKDYESNKQSKTSNL